MYQSLTFLHSINRWLVVITLLIAVYRAFIGVSKNKPFSKFDNAIRHWTATIAHIQLILGVILYFKSPIIKYFWAHFTEAKNNIDVSFFGIYHSLAMFVAIIILTIGSALAKRKDLDLEKHRTLLYWFGCALLIIFIVIPWPFSPFTTRPYYR